MKLDELQNNLPFDGMARHKIIVAKNQYQHEAAAKRWPQLRRKRLQDLRDARPGSMLLFDYYLNRLEIYEIAQNVPVKID